MTVDEMADYWWSVYHEVVADDAIPAVAATVADMQLEAELKGQWP